MVRRTKWGGIMIRWFGALLALTLAVAAPAAERRKVIIDQDALGGPGLQPILMLLQDPSIEVLGITIVSGDGWQPEETAQALRMLELVGRTDIPVVAGATYPLINSKERNKRREALYGDLAYRGAWTDTWPAGDTMNRRKAHAPEVVPAMAEGMPKTKPAAMSAAEFLLAKSRQFPGQITILAMGPLTNLALAQRMDDGFAGRIREVVTEGGNFVGRDMTAQHDTFALQVAYAPRMSFNHVWDPEAAHIVFTSPWPKLTLITNDASEAVTGTQAVLDRATAGGKPVAAYVKRIAEAGFPLWDEVQAAAWSDPSIVTSRGTMAMDVDLMPGANYGALLIWPAGKGPGLGERDVDVVYAVDPAKAQGMFVALIGR
jgi:inosine-uridine nucleoside N-ribohydrolase